MNFQDHLGKEVWIKYVEDDDSIASAYVKILEIKDGLIKFQTYKNLITIPTSRIIKIKERLSDDH